MQTDKNILSRIANLIPSASLKDKYQFWKEVSELALFALAYWLMVRLGLLLTAQPEGVASIWPVSGLALGMLLLKPRLQWKKLLVVIFLTNVAGNWSGGHDLFASLGFALANIVEPLFAAWALQYFCGPKVTFQRAVDVIALFGVAVFINGVTAMLGAAVSVLTTGASFSSAWLIWWIADGLGMLLVTPLIVYWLNNKQLIKTMSVFKTLEALLLIFILIAFAYLLFSHFTHAEEPFLRNYMLFPFLIWLAFRFTPREMANSLFLFSAIAFVYTLRGYGIFAFADQTRTQHLISLQIYLAIIAFSGLLLSAVVAERKEIESALRISESNLRAIIDLSPIPMALNDDQQNITFLNPSFIQTFGYTLEDIPVLGAWWLKAYPDPEYRQWVIDIWRVKLEVAKRTKTPFEPMQVNIRCKDGATKTIIANAGSFIPSFKDNHLVVLYDITQRVQAEESLRASEEKYRLVADFTYDWEAWHAPYGTYLYVSPSCERITGYTASEFIADANLIVKITHPEDQEKVSEHFYSTVNHQKETACGEFEFRIVTKSGEMRWITHSCVPVYGDNGKWLGRRESNRDITTRKQSEAVLHARLRLNQFADTHSVDDLLQNTLNEAEALTESKIGFFHTLDPDQKTLSLQMWSSNTLANMCTAEGKGLHYMVDKAGVWVDCVYKREPVTYNNYASLLHRKGLPEGHAPITRILVVPIMRNDLIVAIFGVGNKLTDYVEQDEKNILQIADLVWDIILRKRSEEEVRSTKNALVLANTDLQTSLIREKELSHTDVLTGINNRRYLFELAANAFDIATRHKLPLTVMMFDIDHFKKINDTYGHDIGDQVLQRVVLASSAELRASDVIGRYGGEEFVIILPVTTAEHAYKLAERIREEVEALRVPTPKGDASVTLSIGIVELLHSPHNEYPGGETETLDSLIRCADEAMYTAKQTGRNRVVIFERVRKF